MTKNIFLTHFKIVQFFTIFVRVRACQYSFKNWIFKNLSKIVEKHFLWWVEQIILTKNVFLALIEIIQIFTIFVRSAPVDIPSKNQISKNCLKLWRNTSFDEWKQIILTKNIFFEQELWYYTIFTIFVRVRACRYSFNNSMFQKFA